MFAIKFHVEWWHECNFRKIFKVVGFLIAGHILCSPDVVRVFLGCTLDDIILVCKQVWSSVWVPNADGCCKGWEALEPCGEIINFPAPWSVVLLLLGTAPCLFVVVLAVPPCAQPPMHTICQENQWTHHLECCVRFCLAVVGLLTVLEPAAEVADMENCLPSGELSWRCHWRLV